VGSELACGRDLGSAQSQLILASTSAQRRAILEQLRIPFEVVTPAYVEADAPGVDPHALVRRHAEGKARSVRAEHRLVLGVDTAVVLDGRVFGKPANRGEAEEMLRALSGHMHTVVSGLCLLGPELDVATSESTDVLFRRLTSAALDRYLESGEWQRRAGAYAIQGFGGRLVERIDGDYLNVVGLPAALLVTLLEQHAPHLL
jgi:septum formation protein